MSWKLNLISNTEKLQASDRFGSMLKAFEEKHPGQMGMLTTALASEYMRFTACYSKFGVAVPMILPCVADVLLDPTHLAFQWAEGNYLDQEKVLVLFANWREFCDHVLLNDLHTVQQ